MKSFLSSYRKNIRRVVVIGAVLFGLVFKSFSYADAIERQILLSFFPKVTAEQKLAFEVQNDLLLIAEFEHLELRVYEFVDGRDRSELISSLKKDPIVRHVEPNIVRESQSLPSDPYFYEQWYLDNQGQVVNGQAGVNDIDVDWPEAMDMFTGTSEVIVAIIDSGVAFDHPELLTALNINWVEAFFDFNGIDDDGNGYVDDLFGWDFYDYGPVPLDENGHGTLVASVVAAERDNGELGVGVAPTARIMPLRAANDFGRFTSVFNIIEASTYAAQNGARIVNMSFGGGPYSYFEELQMSWLFEQGLLVVAAAGNGGFDFLGDDNDLTPYYPASYPTVLSVAAIDRTGQLSAFSNYGATSVDVAAPGTDIFGADLSRILTYQEDFEGEVTGWTQVSNTDLIWSFWTDLSGNTWLTDSIDGDFQATEYEPNTLSTLFSPSIELGFGPQLQYRVWYELEFLYDFLLVSVSADNGANWYPIDFLTGDCFGCDQSGGGAIRQADLSGFDFSQVQLKFELFSDESVEADGVYIDDISITEVTTFEYDGTQFQYSDGTSFAAPIVSGIASLVWAQKPQLPLRWMYAVLISANKEETLESKVQSGGVISAERALWLILSDFDGDGLDNGDEMVLGTDIEDGDTDDDGVNDRDDAFPLDPSETSDTDGDGVGDNADAFPKDPEEVRDSDADGIGDNADVDDDNDQMPDEWELANGLNPLRDDSNEDPDGDSLTNLEEYLRGTDPKVADLCFDTDIEGDTPSQSHLSVERRLAIVNPASNTRQQSFMRFVNPNNSPIDVELYGFDDNGIASKGGPITFSLDAMASLQLTSQDLEFGNENKGISNLLCDGSGKWQLIVRSSDDVEAQSLIRTPDGFLTSLSEAVRSEASVHFVDFVNPASNRNQQTFLRIVNHSADSGVVTIRGIDDHGTNSESLSFDIGSYQSRQLTAQDLELGNSTKGLRGTLGDGSGKWRLEVDSEVEVSVLSLIRSSDGFLTNLSALVPVEFASEAISASHSNLHKAKARSIAFTDLGTTIAASVVKFDFGIQAPRDDNVYVRFQLEGANLLSTVNSTDLEVEVSDGAGSADIFIVQGGRTGDDFVIFEVTPIDEPLLQTDVATLQLPDIETSSFSDVVLQFSVYRTVTAAVNLGEPAYSTSLVVEEYTGEPDSDGDGLLDSDDNCPLVMNPDQADIDEDGTGDECDLINDLLPDEDDDSVPDEDDNCPSIPNEDQTDQDLDGVGDACEVDYGTHMAYFVTPADSRNYQSFLRIVNRSASDTANVILVGIDDAGRSAPNGSIEINLGANQSIQLLSSDLEDGNSAKGLVGSFGNGVGNWRLQVSANQEVSVMSLVRTPDGFLTNVGTVARMIDGEVRVLFMNPGSNKNQRSFLRLINDSEFSGTINIQAHDDRGERGGTVQLQLGAREAFMLSAEDLELGRFNGDGALGDGAGKWQVTLNSDIDLTVQSLLEAPGGFLTNLSGQVK